jgi:hypothetical protein
MLLATGIWSAGCPGLLRNRQYFYKDTCGFLKRQCMKTIVKTEIKLMQSKYGNALYFIPFYQLGKSVYYFIGLFACGMIAWQFIDRGYLTQSVYEQLVIIISFLWAYFFKKEKPYTLIPYITKLTVSSIRNYILVIELFSGFNFILIPLVVSVQFLSNSIEYSTITYLFIRLWIMGLLLNLLTKMIKYFRIGHKFFFITIMSITLAYSLILVWFYRTSTVFSYSNFPDNGYYIIILLAGIALLIPGYFYVIKQELYQAYEGNHWGRKIVHNFNPGLISSNIFNKVLILEYLRCKLFRKFSMPMISYAIGGIVCFIVFDLKSVGLGLFLGIYTSVMLPFTIYLSSNYFDGLYTKPISIKLLLFSSFYIHIIITTGLFLILLIFIVMYDQSNVLPLMTLYLYTSGPMALLLLHNILFAQKFDLFPVQPDSKIEKTFAQTVTGIISGVSLFGCAAIIHFFSTIGCYILLSISIVTVMTYSYWIDFLYRKFMQRKYRIMENLRKI